MSSLRLTTFLFFFCLLLSLPGSVAGWAESPSPVTPLLKSCQAEIAAISVDHARALFYLGGVLFVDCREPHEFQAGHIPGAVNVPRGELEFTLPRIASEKDMRIVLYCRSGQRACLGAQTLARMGYTRVVNMNGGWLRWNRAWYPVE